MPQWSMTFASPAKGKARAYQYSVMAAEGEDKGINSNPEERYAAQVRNQPYLMAAVRTDSDAAYETAIKKSEKFLRTHPGAEPAGIVLALTPDFGTPTWRIVWGESIERSEYSVYVDAATGEFIKEGR